MIVKCPNCSLEQPLDPFCAGCGKQLPKLIEEHKTKLKARNSRTRKVIGFSVLAFGLGFYAYYAYQHPEVRPFSSATASKTVRLKLATETIKASKYRKKDFAQSLKVKNFTVTSKRTGKAEKLKISKDSEVQALKVETPKIQDFYILNIGSCTDGLVDSGPLSQDEVSFFLDCARVISKLGLSETSDIDPSLSFENTVFVEQQKEDLKITYSFSVDDPPVTSSFLIKLKTEKNRTAGFISVIKEDRALLPYLGSKKSAQTLLKKSALGRALGTPANDKASPKGYFLAVYE